MRKYLLLSILVAWSAQLLAGTVTTVRLNPDIDYTITGTTNLTFTLGLSAPSGDATSETAPARVYVPMDGPATPDDESRFFTVPGATLFTTTSAATTVNFPLYLNATATDYYLYAAVKDSTGVYKVAKQFSTTPFNGTTNLNQNFSIPIASFCTQLATDCTSLSGVSGTEVTRLVYFYFDTSTGTAIGNTITPSTAGIANGIYFELNMSNRVYPSSAIVPTITNVRVGDKRLTLEYTSNSSILQPKMLKVLQYAADPGVTYQDKPIQDSFTGGATFTVTEFPYSQTGELAVPNLTNNQAYYLSFVFVDNYLFASVVSNAQTGTPLEIQELLKKNQCYLLTAGFGEDHYVISYFRHFRDTILVNSFLGRKFIQVYYGTAPKYAVMMYGHESIRAVVRGAAYVLYFVFNYIYVLFFAGVSVAFFILYRRGLKRVKVN